MEFQIKAMDMWFRTLPGAIIAEMELTQLGRFMSTIPGDTAVQIGGPSNISLLQKSHIQDIYYCSDQVGCMGDGRRVQCDYRDLPFESDSISLVVLAHVLEFSKEPQAILHEVYRVLKPGGQLLLLGFNRWSMWSVVRRLKHQKGYPWAGTFYSIWRVKKWLTQLDYGLISNKSFCFVAPSKKRPRSKWLMLTEVLGQVFVPKMGAIHLIYAQKKVSGMTPLTVLWTRQLTHLAAKKRAVQPIVRIKS